MTNILPNYTGLHVNSINYGYTAVKEVQDPLVVTVGNLNARGTGYVFRSRDDWTGLAGNTITKSVQVDSIPQEYWGSGEISVEGKGFIRNPYVIYNYRYDTCFGTVITDPACPNYKPPTSPTIPAAPREDEIIKQVLDSKTSIVEEDTVKKEPVADKKQKPTAAISAKSNNGLLDPKAEATAKALEALNNIPNFAQYSVAIPGGVYQDVLKYVDKSMPDSRSGLRMNYAQDRLHTKLTDLQYGISKD